MKILKKILLGLGAVILLLLIISLFLPSGAFVERSITIKAPASVVFEQINTLKNWEKWSPWHKIDTAMAIVYEGPASGAGAKYTWKSEHPQVGNGSLTIVSSTPNDSIISSLDFMEGGLAKGGYYFTQTDSGTVVRWTMGCDMGWNP